MVGLPPSYRLRFNVAVRILPRLSSMQNQTEDSCRLSGRSLAIAAVMAAGGFLLPQRIPLEYYAPSTSVPGLNYLEIRCGSSRKSGVQVYLDTGRGFNEREKIAWPMEPGEGLFTYTFVLPDARLHALRIDPFAAGPGKFTVAHLRIVDRNGKEVRRLAAVDFVGLHQLAVASSGSEGWTWSTAPGADDPSASISFSPAVVPNGMNKRNLARCAVSAGYLSMVLWAVLLAIWFAFRPSVKGWSLVRSVLGFLVVAALFSLVAHRGLIKETQRQWRSSGLHEARHAFVACYRAGGEGLCGKNCDFPNAIRLARHDAVAFI